MKFTPLIFAMTVGTMLAACAGSADDVSADAADTLPPPPPESTTATFTLTPKNPVPGETFAAMFSVDHSRGGYFVLSLWDGEAWNEPSFVLESDANQDSPTARPILDVGYGGDDYGVSGAGPDGLVMPDELADGYWRLCTANARDDACTQLSVGLDIPTDDSADQIETSPPATTSAATTTPPPADPTSVPITWLDGSVIRVEFPDTNRGSCTPFFEWTGTEWSDTGWHGTQWAPGETSPVSLAQGCFDDEAEGPGLFDVGDLAANFGTDVWFRACDPGGLCSEPFNVGARQ